MTDREEIRAQFVAQAMHALMITPYTWAQLGLHPTNGLDDIQNVANFAVQYADAAIAAMREDSL